MPIFLMAVSCPVSQFFCIGNQSGNEFSNTLYVCAFFFFFFFFLFFFFFCFFFCLVFLSFVPVFFFFFCESTHYKKQKQKKNKI